MSVPSARHARLIAETELRRRWRSTADNTLQLVALGIVGLFYLAMIAAAAFGGHVAGRELAAGDVEAPLRYARYAAAAALVFPAFVVGFRTAARIGSLDALDGLLTTVPHTDLVAGLLAAEAAWFVGTFGLAAVPALAALALGSGSVALAATTALALASLGALGVLSGFALGFGARTLFARSEFVARHRTAIGALVFVAYLAVLGSGNIDSVVQPVLEAVRRSPVGWFADLALLPANVGARSALAAAAAVGTPVAAAALFAASDRLAAHYWFGDQARGPSGETRHFSVVRGASAPALDGLPRSSAVVARKSWLRALRAPIKLVYVAYPLFVLIGPVSNAIEAGVVFPTIPPLLALYGAWAAGAAFTLNPLGDEGAVLPVTLTTPVTGREFVNGLLVAAATLGTAITALVAVGTAVASPLDPLAVAAVALVALALPTAAAAIAAGAGSLFPKFETANVTRSHEAVVPSLYAFGLYSLVLVVVWLPAGLGVMAAAPLADAAGIGEAAVTAAGSALTVVVAAAVGVVAYRHAARRFSAYHL